MKTTLHSAVKVSIKFPVLKQQCEGVALILLTLYLIKVIECKDEGR